MCSGCVCVCVKVHVCKMLSRLMAQGQTSKAKHFATFENSNFSVFLPGLTQPRGQRLIFPLTERMSKSSMQRHETASKKISAKGDATFSQTRHVQDLTAADGARVPRFLSHAIQLGYTNTTAGPWAKTKRFCVDTGKKGHWGSLSWLPAEKSENQRWKREMKERGHRQGDRDSERKLFGRSSTTLSFVTLGQNL